MLIFAIDDEKNILEETKETIAKAAGGADIRTFTRTADALKNIEQGEKPDVVFSDIEMPGVSGLEFAIKLKALSPDTRIIFVTGYEKYAIKAFKVKAQGYLLKPLNVEEVKEELKCLPGKTGKEQEKLVVQCFGHFEVYWHGKPVIFKRKQTKELFAYLVYREGAVCSVGEIALALWEKGSDGKAEMNRIRVLINDFRSTLKEIGMDNLLIRGRRLIGIRREEVDCDYYRMLEGDMDAVNACRGAYMPEYSWAELTNARLQFRKG